MEKYSHVMHLVSQVEADLAPGKTGLDAVRATFPAGTVSGAPKIRAIQTVDALEPHRRGFYAGIVGYVEPGREPGHLHHHPQRGEAARPPDPAGRGRGGVRLEARAGAGGNRREAGRAAGLLRAGGANA